MRLSQEMIAIVTVGIALAWLNLAMVESLREEGRADRARRGKRNLKRSATKPAPRTKDSRSGWRRYSVRSSG